jgi:hypothetical protein
VISCTSNITPLGRIGQVGHRIHGDRRLHARGIGWEYVHAIDDHSRVADVEVLADQLGTTCAAFLQGAVTWQQTRGIRTQRVMSDNGSGYVSGRGAPRVRLSVSGISEPRLYAVDQREGRTLYPHAAAGMGGHRTVRVVSAPSSEAPTCSITAASDRMRAWVNQAPWSRLTSAG